MTYTECRAGRRIDIRLINDHSAGVAHVVVDQADFRDVFKGDTSESAPGYLGSYDSSMSRLARDIYRGNLVHGATQCARCVGQPARSCDIRKLNENDRGPQPNPSKQPATASSA